MRVNPLEPCGDLRPAWRARRQQPARPRGAARSWRQRPGPRRRRRRGPHVDGRGEANGRASRQSRFRCVTDAGGDLLRSTVRSKHRPPERQTLRSHWSRSAIVFVEPLHGNRVDERAGDRQDPTRQHQNDMGPDPRARRRFQRSFSISRSEDSGAAPVGPRNATRRARQACARENEWIN